MTYKVFIVTGEPSGDLHGSYVVQELKQLIPTIHIACIGGDNMQKAGAEIFHPIHDMSAIGLGAFAKIFDHIKLGERTVRYLKEQFKPDIVLLIDYGGFNLWFASLLKEENYKVFYYIAPQVWASRKHRLTKIKRYVDKVLYIFPFEKELYDSHGIEATYVGHPLISQLPCPDAVEIKKNLGLDNKKNIIGVFPGSRHIEIKFLLRTLVESCCILSKELENSVFLISRSKNVNAEIFDQIIQDCHVPTDVDIRVLDDGHYNILAIADFVLAKSGTTTLEAALFLKPMVIYYAYYFLGYCLYLLVRYIKFVGLPNIVTGKQIVPELIQFRFNKQNIVRYTLDILKNDQKKEKMIEDLGRLRGTLDKGNAAFNVAQEIVHFLTTR